MMNAEIKPQRAVSPRFIILHSYFYLKKWWVASDSYRVLAG
jgi:hypothetical protein